MRANLRSEIKTSEVVGKFQKDVWMSLLKKKNAQSGKSLLRNNMCGSDLNIKYKYKYKYK